MTVLSTLRTLKSEDSSALQATIDTVNAAKDALRRAGYKTEHWLDIFVYFAVRALDPTTRKDWETSLGAARERPTYQKFRDFLKGRIRALQLSEQSRVLERASGPSRSSRTETTKGAHPNKRNRINRIRLRQMRATRSERPVLLQ